LRILVPNTCSSTGASNPSQGPEFPAELGDKVCGVLAVVGFHEMVIVVVGGLLGTFHRCHG
jgi:hypothetical protein